MEAHKSGFPKEKVQYFLLKLSVRVDVTEDEV